MPDGASQSQVRLSSIIESTRGTTPASPAYNINRILSGSFLQVDKNFEQSNEINSTRDPGARVGGVAGCSGTISMPLVKDVGWEHWGESALSGVFTALAPSAITGTWATAGDTFTRASGSFLTASPATRFEIGDMLFAAGTTNNQTQLNGAMSDTTGTTATVDTVDATTISNATGYIKIDNEIMAYTGRTSTSFTGLTRGALGTTAATHADNAPVLIGRTITNITATVLTFANDQTVNESSVSTTFTTNVRVLVPGTTRAFYSVEQHFADKSLYEIFKGVEVNTMGVNVPTSGEITTEFAVLGTSYATGQVASSTYTAANTKSPFAGSVSGSALTLNGAALGTCLESLTVNVNNNRALKYGVGEQFACFVEEGTRQIDLSFAAYLVDLTLQGYFQAETRFSMFFTSVSADGDRYQFVFPRLVLTAAPKGVSGQTIVENYSASAEKDSTSNSAFWMREVTRS